ncbi:MAG: oxidase, partial [Gammaproteobacteria bacterium]|nr:oxidase [Gammaproteobacteria bacterium]
MDRRKFLLDSSCSIVGGLLIPRFSWPAAADSLPAGAIASEIMDALPGKRPLIKRSFRPPNYETPGSVFRADYTPNDAFYVRWHSGVPEVTLAAWRLRVGG